MLACSEISWPKGVRFSADKEDSMKKRDEEMYDLRAQRPIPARGERTRVERRHFLMGVAVTGCTTQSVPENPAPATESGSAGAPRPDPSEDPDTAKVAPEAAVSVIPRRSLGTTGETVSMMGLGGYHIGIPSEEEAIRIMHRAMDEGMTFFDNCWDYHDGESERRMGRALRGGRRDQVFLMTKIDGRNKQAAAAQIDDSLRRLQTDHVDLLQIHEVVRPEDPAWVFREGAIEALLEAREAGKLRFIGFTGHKSPAIHLSMLDQAEKHGFKFDTVQMPLNVLDPHYESFQERVLPRLNHEGIAALGMKPIASGAALKSGVVTAPECLRYALSQPASVVITGCDSMDILEQALSVAKSFTPLSEQEQVALLERTRPYGKDGSLEGFKTGEQFDATKRNPHWLTTGSISSPT